MRCALAIWKSRKQHPRWKQPRRWDLTKHTRTWNHVLYPLTQFILMGCVGRSALNVNYGNQQNIGIQGGNMNPACRISPLPTPKILVSFTWCAYIHYKRLQVPPSWVYVEDLIGLIFRAMEIVYFFLNMIINKKFKNMYTPCSTARVWSKTHNPLRFWIARITDITHFGKQYRNIIITNWLITVPDV